MTHDNTDEPTVARSWPLLRFDGDTPLWAVPGSGGARYERDARLEALWRAAQRGTVVQLALWDVPVLDAAA